MPEKIGPMINREPAHNPMEGELWRICKNSLFRLAYALAGETEAGKDLCQQTVMVVLQHLRAGRVREVKKLKAYMHATARFLWRNQSRKKCEEPLATNFEETATIGNPLTGLMERERARQVHLLLPAMRHGRDRELLTRYYLRGEPKTALCAHFGVDRKGLDKLMYRARKRFALLWKKTHNRLTPGF